MSFPAWRGMSNQSKACITPRGGSPCLPGLTPLGDTHLLVPLAVLLPGLPAPPLPAPRGPCGGKCQVLRPHLGLSPWGAPAGWAPSQQEPVCLTLGEPVALRLDVWTGLTWTRGYALCCVLRPRVNAGVPLPCLGPPHVLGRLPPSCEAQTVKHVGRLP